MAIESLLTETNPDSLHMTVGRDCGCDRSTKPMPSQGSHPFTHLEYSNNLTYLLSFYKVHLLKHTSLSLTFQ